jgi:hypothetical protein
VNLVARAIEEPMRWIASNAGQDGAIVVQKVRDMKAKEGFNALSDVKAGVIDASGGRSLRRTLSFNPRKTSHQERGERH